MSDQNELIAAPTALDQLVSELNHYGKSQYIGLLFPVPTRLQVDSFTMVEALTHHAGTSRNKIMNQLVEVGIQEVLGALPVDVQRTIRHRAGEIYFDIESKNGGLLERGEV